MNVLICGRGKGSWIMRGEQIGAVLGARMTSDPTPTEWAWADVAILLKKTATEFAPAAQAAHVPIVWDVLDVWSQPRDNSWTVAEGLAYVQQLRRQIQPAAIIGATAQMARDLGGVYIPHHSRLGLRPTTPRGAVTVVAYDGSERYLGAWEPALRAACRRRGWQFQINPPDLSAVDVLVALREGWWDGPICRAWKSGVKLVNAICAGRPVLTQPSAARDELQPIGAAIDTVDALDAALDACADPAVRARAAMQDGAAFTVEAVAAMWYRPLLARVCAEATCAA